jgi:hypothetical protein
MLRRLIADHQSIFTLGDRQIGIINALSFVGNAIGDGHSRCCVHWEIIVGARSSGSYSVRQLFGIRSGLCFEDSLRLNTSASARCAFNKPRLLAAILRFKCDPVRYRPAGPGPKWVVFAAIWASVPDDPKPAPRPPAPRYIR